MSKIIDFINSKAQEIISIREGIDSDKIGLALNSLKENIVKLEQRMQRHTEVEKKLYDDNDHADKRHGQLMLVDAIEAIHQQVYVTLSSFISLLNYIGIDGLINHPINSVERFLKHLHNKYTDRIDPTVFEYLNKSREFRSKFVDHPQQHKLHDWMTINYNDISYVVYFKRGATGDVKMIDADIPPDHPSFIPPISCEDFYVSPNKSKTYAAVCELISKFLP